jgi:hypothetical protein
MDIHEAFEREWDMRETLLKLADVDEAVIQRHRKEILRTYGLTEEELQANEKDGH